MFDRLKNIFRSKDAPRPSAPASAPGATPPRPQAPVQESPKADKAPERSPEKEKDKGKGTAKVPAPKPQPTPEDLCGITPKMSKDEVRQRLAVLYRRYNRATSSLDAKLRAEAEEMLDAIVAIREKVFGPI